MKTIYRAFFGFPCVGCAWLFLTISIISCSTANNAAVIPSAVSTGNSYANPAVYGFDLQLGTEHEALAVYKSGFKPASLTEEDEEKLDKIAYPAKAKQQKIEGKVILRLYIDSTGKLELVKVMKPVNIILVKASVHSLSTLAFNPATLNGHPVNSIIHCTFDFRLDKLTFVKVE